MTPAWARAAKSVDERQGVGADAGGEAVAGVVDRGEPGLVVRDLEDGHDGSEDLFGHGGVVEAAGP